MNVLIYLQHSSLKFLVFNKIHVQVGTVELAAVT